MIFYQLLNPEVVYCHRWRVFFLRDHSCYDILILEQQERVYLLSVNKCSLSTSHFHCVSWSGDRHGEQAETLLTAWTICAGGAYTAWGKMIPLLEWLFIYKFFSHIR